MEQFFSSVLLSLLAAVALAAQTAQSFVGTVAATDLQAGALAIQPDKGDRLLARVSSDTILQRIRPGEKDLKKAESIELSTIAPGDRVLVSLDPGTNDARRIVVMSSEDIRKRDQADRQDWIERGIIGVVVGKKVGEITLAIKGTGTEKTATIDSTERTRYRRYAPDSVRFADAKPSRPEEIQVGDQLRARGQKSADGLHLAAEDVVFGTFVTKAGAVASVDPAAREIHITEMGTGKPLAVKLTADTQIKALPEFPGFGGQFPGGRGGQARPGDPPQFPGAAAGRGGPFSQPDPAELIEHMPAAPLETIKIGQMIVVSSTKGAKPEELTAITVVANAQMLIQMATMRSGGQAPKQNSTPQGLSPGVMSGMGTGGLGLDLSGMNP